MVEDIQVVEAEAGDAETVSRMVYALLKRSSGPVMRLFFGEAKLNVTSIPLSS